MNASSVPTRRLPLTVIGGFLGSGKTTLLNRMLDRSAGRRLAVLVNDFGAINIDAALVARRNADAIALTNGCVCCSIGDDLTGALIRVLDMQPRVDAVVIEASGVSDPWRIAQVGLADRELALDGVIVLVDAAAVLEQANDALLTDTLRRQLRAADLIVLNKTDLVDDAQRQRVREWAAAEVAVTMIETTQAAVPMSVLVGPIFDVNAAQVHKAAEGVHVHEAPGPDEPAHDEHAHQFETWACRPSRVLSAPALRNWLREMPAGVLRLKGVLRTDEHDWSELQFAGRHGSLRRAPPPVDGAAALVAIGLRGRLPVEALSRMFEGDATRSRDALL